LRGDDKMFFRAKCDWIESDILYAWTGDIVRVDKRITERGDIGDIKLVRWKNLISGETFITETKTFNCFVKQARLTNREIIEAWIDHKGAWIWNDKSESNGEYIQTYNQFIGYRNADYVIVYWHKGEHHNHKAITRFRNQLIAELKSHEIGYMDEVIHYEGQ